MNQPSRSASVERKNSYKDDPRKDLTSNGNRDDRYNSPSQSMKRSVERRGRSKSPVLQVPGNVLYVGNLSRRLNENEVQEKFEKYGKIQSIQMVRDPFTHESRGFAFVEFVNVDDATEALESLDQKEFDGRRMNVERSKRGRGYQKTPGEYLGHFKSQYRQKSPSPYYKRKHSRGPGGEGGRRSRDRYSRERSPRSRPSRNPYPRDRHSRSRSRERGNDRKYRDDYRNRSRERSRERYRDPRDSRDMRNMRDNRDVRDRSNRGNRYGRDGRDYRDNRDNGYRVRVRDRSRSRG